MAATSRGPWRVVWARDAIRARLIDMSGWVSTVDAKPGPASLRPGVNGTNAWQMTSCQ